MEDRLAYRLLLRCTFLREAVGTDADIEAGLVRHRIDFTLLKMDVRVLFRCIKRCRRSLVREYSCFYSEKIVTDHHISKGVE